MDLHRACELNDVERVRQLVSNGANIQSYDSNGLQPIHVAIKHGNIEIVELLLQVGVPHNAQDNSSISNIYYAITHNRAEIASLLIKLNAQVNPYLNHTYKFLYLAIKYNCDEIVKIILQQSKNMPAQPETGFEPLHLAAKKGRSDLCRLMIEHKIMLNVIDVKKRTPLHLAAQGGKISTFLLIWEQSVLNKFNAILSLDNDNYTPVHYVVYSNPRLLKMLISMAYADEFTTQILQFKQAVNQGNFNTVLELIKNNITAKFLNGNTAEHGANVNKRDHRGFTPLHNAIAEKQTEVVRFLINEQQANFNCVSRNSQTPLYISACNGFIEGARLLLQSGANLDLNKPKNIIYDAIVNDQVEFLRFLIEEKWIDIDCVNEYGYTPLLLALELKKSECIYFLVEKGANVTVKTNSGLTALHFPQFETRDKFTKLFVAKGCNVNAQDIIGRTPLYVHAELGIFESVRHLCINGGDINIADNEDQSPLHGAICHWSFKKQQNVFYQVLSNSEIDEQKAAHAMLIDSHIKTIKTLVEFGANLEFKDLNGHTPLFYAMRLTCTKTRDFTEIVQLLINSGADINANNVYNSIPLHFSVIKSENTLSRLLISNDADINAKNVYGQTALNFSIIKNGIETTSLLIEKNVDINAVDNNGISALHCAVETGRLNFIKLLLKNGADVNLVDKFGRTCLHLATKKNSAEIISLLLLNGANINTLDRMNRNPAHYVANYSNLECFCLITAFGANINEKDNFGQSPLEKADKRWENVDGILNEYKRAVNLNDKENILMQTRIAFGSIFKQYYTPQPNKKYFNDSIFDLYKPDETFPPWRGSNVTSDKTIMLGDIQCTWYNYTPWDKYRLVFKL